jgi:hypothetical protein
LTLPQPPGLQELPEFLFSIHEKSLSVTITIIIIISLLESNLCVKRFF